MEPLNAGRQAALVDTSVLIRPPATSLDAYADESAVSMITVAELQYGVNVGDPLEALSRRRRLRLVVENYRLLPFDLETTEVYGMLAGLVRDSGRNLRPRRFDLLIAATAARYGMLLLTRDKSGFVGLERAVRVVQVD